MQLGFDDVFADSFARFVFELQHKRRAAFTDVLDDVGDTDGEIGVVAYKLQGAFHLVGVGVRMAALGNAAGEVDYCAVSQAVDLIHAEATFALLRVEVYQLIGFFNVQIAADRSHFSDHADKTDKYVFGLAQRVVCDLAFNDRRRFGDGVEEFVQSIDVARAHEREELLFKIICAV